MSDFDVQHRDCFESLAAMRDAGGVDIVNDGLRQQRLF